MHIATLSINIEPGVSSDCSGMDCGKSEEMLECGYAIIPPEKSLDCILDGNEEGTFLTVQIVGHLN